MHRKEGKNDDDNNNNDDNNKCDKKCLFFFGLEICSASLVILVWNRD